MLNRQQQYRQTRLLWLWSSLMVLVALSGFADEPSRSNPDLAYAERALRRIGAATDDNGLLAFIRTRTLTEEKRKEIAAQVRALGSPDYAEREKSGRQLVAWGRVALSFLRPAVNDPDLETSRRARRCVDQIQRHPNPSLLVLAALLVKERRPAGAVPVLLDCLHSAEDAALQENWFDVLRTVGWREGRADPALLAALSDKRPLFRAAAAHVLGRGSDAAVRARVAPLVRDPDAHVRFEAAAALARFGDEKAVAVLVALLEEGPFSQACEAEYVLRLLADRQGPQLSMDRDETSLRRRCRSAWEDWWKEESERVDWLRLRRKEPSQGQTVVCEEEAGGTRVWAWVQGGEPCWEIRNLEGAHAVQLFANGHLLLAEHHANRVTERDHEGKIYWEQQTPDNPISCQRLANGNTLIATYKDVYEVTRDHNQVLHHTDRRGFRDALRLKNGNILYVTGDGILVEYDATCEHLLHSIEIAGLADGAKYRARIEPLLNGRYLVTLGGRNRIIEIDPAGKIQWEQTIRTPMSATRLRNGNTLIACYEDRSVIEVDRAGKEINKHLLQGRPFAVGRQ
jgi:hypothetical protein